MAQLNRTESNELVESNVYDNNAKEIDPEMVREVLLSIIESHFNLQTDELQNLKYNSTKQLNEVVSLPYWGATGSFDVGSTTGALTGNIGIISNASVNRLNSSNSEITIDLNQNISDRKLSVNIFTNDTEMDNQNDLSTPTIRVVSSTQIIVGLKEISSNTQSVSIEILAFKTA